ncbi:MAG: hypothetical protein AAF460_03980 [Pseudomonadota bacterium]
MKQSETPSNPEMEMLRNILVGEERRDLDDLRQQLDDARESAANNQNQLAELTHMAEALQARADDQGAFLNATADVLPEALKQAGEADSAAVSRALSPFVVSSIRKEIVNSRDEMVDALYPITGRLVTAAVRNAIAKLSEDINERMNALTSGAMWRARVQAWRTGEPVSKFVLAGSGEFRVLRAMLLDRGAGTPLSVAESEDVPDRSDTNLISGLLAALSNLAQEVYTSAEDELRRVDLNGRQIAFRRSAAQLLVVEFIGQLPADAQAEIDRRFVEIVSREEHSDQAGLDAAVASLLRLRVDREASAANRDANPYLKWALLGVVFIVAGWLIGGALGRWQLERTAAQVQATVDADNSLRAFPVRVSADHDNSVLVVRGLVPQSTDADQLRSDLRAAAGAIPVQLVLTSVAAQADLERAEATVSSLRQQNAALGQAVDNLQTQLGGADHSGLPTEVLAMRERLSRIDSVFAEPLQALADAASQTRVRFAEGVDLAEPEQAQRDLKRLVERLLKTPALLSITPIASSTTVEDQAWATARARYIRTQLLRDGAAAVQLEVTEPRLRSDVDADLSVVFSTDTDGAL